MQAFQDTILLIVIFSLYKVSHETNTLGDDIPSSPLQQFDIDLVNERHRSPQFIYKAISTAVPYSYHNLPKKSSITSGHIEDKTTCNAILLVELIGFSPPEKVVCLHQDDLEEVLFEKGSQISIFDAEFKIEEFHSKLLPVIGFVLNEPSSVVTGYLVNKNFYGTIRLYDKVNMYTTHFYIEPIENAQLYSRRFLTEKVQRSTGEENAIIFEYIPHDDDTASNTKPKDRYNEKGRTTENPDESVPHKTSTDKHGNRDLDIVILDNARAITSTGKDFGEMTSVSDTDDNLSRVILDNARAMTSTGKDFGEMTTSVGETDDDLSRVILDNAEPMTSTEADGDYANTAPTIATTVDDLTRMILENAAPRTSTGIDLDYLIDEQAAPVSTTEDDLTRIILDNVAPMSSTGTDTDNRGESTSTDQTGTSKHPTHFHSTKKPKNYTDRAKGGKFHHYHSTRLPGPHRRDRNSAKKSDSKSLTTSKASSKHDTTTLKNDFGNTASDNIALISTTEEHNLDAIILNNAVSFTSTSADDYIQNIMDENSHPMTSTSKGDSLSSENPLENPKSTTNSEAEDDIDKIIMENSLPLSTTSKDGVSKVTTKDEFSPTIPEGEDIDKIIVDNSISITSTIKGVFEANTADKSVSISTSTISNEENLDPDKFSSTGMSVDVDKIVIENSIPLTSTMKNSDETGAGKLTMTSTFKDSEKLASTTASSGEQDKSGAIKFSSTSTAANSDDKITPPASVPKPNLTEDDIENIIVDYSVPLTSTAENTFVSKKTAGPRKESENDIEKMIADNSMPLTSTMKDKSSENKHSHETGTTENEFDVVIVDSSFPITSTAKDNVVNKPIYGSTTTIENDISNTIKDTSRKPTTPSAENKDKNTHTDDTVKMTTTEDMLETFIVDNAIAMTSTENIKSNILYSTSDKTNLQKESSTSSEESLSSTTEDIYPLKEVWTTEEGGSDGAFWTSTISVPPGFMLSSPPTTSGPNPMFPWTSPTTQGHNTSHFHSTKNPHSRRNSKIHHYHSTRVPGPHRRKRKRKRPSIVSPNNGLWLTTDHPRSGHSFTSTTSSGSVAADLFSTTDAPLVGSGKHTSSSSLTGAHSWSSTSSPGASTTPGVIPPHLHSTKKVKSKSKHHFHSTRVPKPKTRRRRAASHISDFHENLISGHDDDVEPIQFNSGSAESDIFDMRREDSLICSLCIWVQPNFAAKFGFNAEMMYGLAEIMDVVRIINWLFRAIDFNEDGLPENIGFSIKRILVADDISFESIARPSTQSFNQPTPSGNSSKEKTFTSEHGYDKKIHTLESKEALDVVMNKLEVKFANCCAIFGFLYHNMAPAISTTTVRGLCTRKNIGIISGYLHAHKIGKYDLVRAMLHTLGHLFGSAHDNILQDECVDNELYSFLNPFPMHPMEQLNVALRPDSLKLSLCSKISIARYLTTDGPNCLTSKTQHFCGNGVLEDDEECDCGSMWQCQISSHCCGESGSAMQCKILRKGHHGCDRHKDW